MSRRAVSQGIVTAGQLAKNELHKRPLKSRQSKKNNKQSAHVSGTEHPSIASSNNKQEKYETTIGTGSDSKAPNNSKHQDTNIKRHSKGVFVLKVKRPLMQEASFGSHKDKKEELDKDELSALHPQNKEEPSALYLHNKEELSALHPHNKEEPSALHPLRGERSDCPPGSDIAATGISPHVKCKATSRHLTSSGAKLIPGNLQRPTCGR